MEYSRRRMLQTTGIAVTAGIPVVSSASATETVDIPILESPDGVEKWETVPRAWDEHRKHTRRVRQRVTDAYLNRPGVKEVSVVGGDDSIGWKRRLKIRVETDSEADHLSLPSKMEGVGVEVGEYQERQNLNCFNTETFKPVLGGVKVQDVNTYGNGTIACIVSDKNSNKFALTCAHMSDRCSGDPTGSKIVQSATDTLGYVKDFDKSNDWMVVSIENRDYKAEIQKELGSSPVGGWVTQSGLESHVDTTIYSKMGCTTGLTTGELNKISINGDDSGCTNWNGEGIATKCNGAKGDSGGPTYFTSSEGKIFIAGITLQAEYPDYGNSACDGTQVYFRTQGYQANKFINNTKYTIIK